MGALSMREGHKLVTRDRAMEADNVDLAHK